MNNKETKIVNSYTQRRSIIMTYQERFAKAKFQDYKKSEAHNLRNVYERYSDKKAEAWKYCQKLCEKHNGQGLKVVSHNRMIFTAGFVFYDESAECWKYMHITPSYDQAVEV